MCSIRSTQEQLRQDHIETLELLQQCKNENSRLKDELKRLRTTGQLAPAVDVESDNAISDDDIAQLVEQSTKQAEEIKMLKARMNQSDVELLKLRNALSAAQQAQGYAVSEKLKKREDEMTNALLEIENSLRVAQLEAQSSSERCSHLETEVASLRTSYAEAIQQIDAKTHTIKDLQTQYEQIHAEMLRFHDESRSLASERELSNRNAEQQSQMFLNQLTALREENERIRRDHHSLKLLAAKHEEEKIDLLSQLQFKDGMNQALQDALTALKSERMTAVQEESTLIYGDSDTESGNRETFQLTEMVSVMRSPPRPATVSSTVTSTDTTGAGGEGSFRFQEFLRLKRENKELKMRLADMGHAAGTTGAAGATSGGLPPRCEPHQLQPPPGAGAVSAVGLQSRSSGALAPLVTPRLHSASGSMRRASPKASAGAGMGVGVGGSIGGGAGGGGVGVASKTVLTGSGKRFF